MRVAAGWAGEAEGEREGPEGGDVNGLIGARGRSMAEATYLSAGLGGAWASRWDRGARESADGAAEVRMGERERVESKVRIAVAASMVEGG